MSSDAGGRVAGGGGGRGKGRGKGGGRGKGKGRGGGSGGGAKEEGAVASSKTAAQKQGSSGGGKGGGGGGGGGKGEGGKGRGGGGGGGGRGKSTRRRKDKDKPAAPAPLTPEEEQKLAEQKAAAKEAAAKEAERLRLQEEARQLQAACDKKRLQQQQVADQVHQATTRLSAIMETVHLHNTHSTVLESLPTLRKEFEASKKKLKSDLKKCTAFVKKIKSGSAWAGSGDVEKDVASLNLSRYVEEVAAALLEAPKKVADIPTIVALCYAMHVRYPDFMTTLVPSLWSVILDSPKKNATDAGSISKLRRIYVRLLCEFVLHGMSASSGNGGLELTKPLLKLVSDASGAVQGYAVADANLVVSFAKAAGFELLGTTPTSIQNDLRLLQQEQAKLEAFLACGKSLEVPEDVNPDDIPLVIAPALAEKAQTVVDQMQVALKGGANDKDGKPFISTTTAQVFQQYCSGALQTLRQSYLDTHSKLAQLEKRCDQDRLMQGGTLSDAREAGLVEARKLKEHLFKSVEALSDVLDEAMPQLQDNGGDDEDDGNAGPGLELWTKGEGENDDFGPFDDEETRSFYCDIPDLLTTIPPALLGMNPQEIEKLQADNARKYGDGDAFPAADDADTELEPISEAQLEEDEAEEAPEDGEETKNAGAVDDENKDTPHYRFQVLLEQELPECNRREQVDELAEKFCVNHGSSKNSRKRLTKALFQVPRTRLDLLPHYSRIAAILDRIYPEVSTPLAVELEQQFHGQAKFKKQVNPEGRLKTARYLGELTKFRVAPPIMALRALRRCLEDFSGFNIDVACCILESCGRYLYRTKHTVAKLTLLIDTMMRLSKAKNLDERYQALINSAFYMVKPPPAAPRKQAKVYPPLEAYLRHLLLVRLEPTESSISFVTKQLLKFPWNDPSKHCGALICKCMLKACRKGRYKAIAAVAAVAANVRRNKPEVAARLIDCCIEEIQWSLEHPNFRDQQRTITYARLLGEMYASSLITGPIVIQQLYNFINFGHEIPEALREASAKQQQSSEEVKDGSALPIYNSAAGVSVAIQEDEEMEDAELETKEELEAPKIVAVSQYSVFDPRVPSPIDPSNSAFRVKLVCTLLEASAKNVVTRSNLSSLEGFIAAFQRYLFTKPSLPTEVEFALLDTFDSLDSQWKKTTSKDKKKGADGSAETSSQGFPRYESWIDAHNATVASEEGDAVIERRSRVRLEALAGVASSEANLDDILNDDDLAMDDDDDYDNSDVDDSDSDDDMDDEEEASIDGGEADAETNDETDDDEEEFDSDEDADDEDYDEEEEFDEEAYMRQMEEEAFERELRRVTMDALEKGKNTARAGSHGKVADYMPSGSQFIRKKSQQVDTAADGEASAVALGGQEGVSFQLLKKGNKGKVEAKELVVPKDTNLAIRASKHDDAADRERDIIKARVLQYEAESAVQEASGGNVYLEQTKLQVIRNRPLSMDVIDRNFGTSRGDRHGSNDNREGGRGSGTPTSGRAPSSAGRGRGGPSSGRGPGRGRGRGRGGRTLKNY
jgi:regulator of nonsense transcripts 2